MTSFSSEKILLLITQNVSELLAAGLPVERAFAEFSDFPSSGKNGKKAGKIARYISMELECGRELFSVLSSLPDFQLPEWYSAFVFAGQKSGKMAEAFNFLAERLKTKNLSKNLFVQSLIYPAFTVLLSSVTGILGASFLGGLSKSGSVLEILTSCIPAFGFLAAAFFATVIFMRRLTAENPLFLIFTALSFGKSAGLSLLDSIELAFPLAQENKRICTCLSSAMAEISCGAEASQAFFDSLAAAGFEREGQLLSMNLSLCKSGSSENPFAKTAALIGQKDCEKKKILLSLEGPFLLCLVAIYLALILQKTLMPVITNFGGIL